MTFPSTPMLCHHRHLDANRAFPAADHSSLTADHTSPPTDQASPVDHTADHTPQNYVAFCVADGCPDGGQVDGG